MPEFTVNGGWSEYGEWSSCTVSCEQGTRTRSRNCDNPPPGIGGQQCSGSEHETEDCNLESCKGIDRTANKSNSKSEYSPKYKTREGYSDYAISCNFLFIPPCC